MRWDARLGGALLIIALAAWAYAPSLHGDFLLDDKALTTENPLVHASDGLYRFWLSTEPADYWPMTNSTFWLEWRLWGTRTTGYHVVNVALHVAAALLLWSVLSELSIPGALLAAILFAVHPVNVESVAWISQRKNTLAMVFFLMSILWYLKAEEEKSREGEEEIRQNSLCGIWYWLSLLAFVLAMLSKGSVAVLPILVLLLVWWRRGGVGQRDLVRTIPFFAIAIGLTVINLWFQTHGKEIVMRDVSLTQRVLGAGGVVWFYLAKAVAPIELAFIYPQWDVRVHDVLWWLPVCAVAAVSVVLARQILVRRTYWRAAVGLAWSVFVVALLPVMGFTDVGFMKHSLVADHYQHIALIAVVALIAAGWSFWRSNAGAGVRTASMLAAGGIVAALAVLTHEQNRLYADPITLYADTLMRTPNSWLAHYNLGNSLAVVGEPGEALKHCQAALQLKPGDPEVLTNNGIALAALGHTPEAIESFDEALRIKPNFAQAYNDKGLTLLNAGHAEEALTNLNEAIRLHADYPEAFLNLGGAQLALHRNAEAVESFEHALQLKPDYPEAYYNLGNAAVAGGELSKAMDFYRQAVAINPNYAEAHNNLGGALVQLRRLREAAEQYQLAMQIKPGYVSAHFNLATTWEAMGQIPGAIDQFLQTIRLKPDYAEAYAGLAEAFEKTGRAAEAINCAEKAATLAQGQNNAELAKQIEQWLSRYRAEQSRRGSSPEGKSPQGNSPQEKLPRPAP